MKPNSILLVLLISFLTSCSIKEQRGPCPCLLSIKICDTLSATGNLAMAIWDENPIIYDKMAMSERPSIYEKSVPKGLHTVSAVVGEQYMIREEKMIKIPLGLDSDRIWGYSNIIDCTQEFAIDTAKFHKHFSMVCIEFQKLINDYEGLELIVRSNTAGLSLDDFSPMEGDFRYTLNLDDRHCGTVCLPRQKQKDHSLRVEIVRSGNVIETLPLWSWIEQTGYDWHKPDLNDIKISIDYRKLVVTVSIVGWKDGEKKIFII